MPRVVVWAVQTGASVASAPGGPLRATGQGRRQGQSAGPAAVYHQSWCGLWAGRPDSVLPWPAALPPASGSLELAQGRRDVLTERPPLAGP